MFGDHTWFPGNLVSETTFVGYGCGNISLQVHGTKRSVVSIVTVYGMSNLSCKHPQTANHGICKLYAQLRNTLAAGRFEFDLDGVY